MSQHVDDSSRSKPKNETIIITLGNYFGLYLRLISSEIIVMVGFVVEGRTFGLKKTIFTDHGRVQHNIDAQAALVKAMQ